MRVLLAELAPVPGDPVQNVARTHAAFAEKKVELAAFPELFVSGYRIGDQFHRLALREGDPAWRGVQEIAERTGATIAIGAPLGSRDRPGEVENAVLVVRPDGSHATQTKRYLPTYGPFEEGSVFTPTDHSAPADVGGQRIGFQICYDAFFPEVSRQLAMAGAMLLVVISASPVTSRRLFEKVLPARAVENAVPLVYVNRVGVEDGVVFGGGSVAFDARGEPIPVEWTPFSGGAAEERVGVVEVDLTEAPRWRPFRPVLRDLASRPTP
jgi:predicted amidohydrolase